MVSHWPIEDYWTTVCSYNSRSLKENDGQCLDEPIKDLLRRRRQELSIVICVSVCLSVCVSHHMSRFHKMFYTCYLLPWLGPPLTTMQYRMYFRFCGWRHVYSWGQRNSLACMDSTKSGIWRESVARRVGHVAGCVPCFARGLTQFAGATGTKTAVRDCLVVWTQAVTFLNKLKKERAGKAVDVDVIDGPIDDDVRRRFLLHSTILTVN